MKVVVLTGMPGSGKSAAVDVARSMGIPVFRMGDAVWAEVGERGLELQDAIVGRIATEMREMHGPGIWAERTIQMVRQAPPSDMIIIDGCRSRAEVETFRRVFGEDLLVLAIVASPETRYQRLMDRAREDDIRTIEHFKVRESRELAWGLGEVIESADMKIDNEGPIEDTRKEIDRLLKRLMG